MKRRHTSTIIPKRPIHAISIKSAIEFLYNTGGATREEIIEATGLNKETVRGYLVTFGTGLFRSIYISAYRKRRLATSWSAVFSLGINIPDLPQPAPRTDRAYAARFRNWQEIKTPDGIVYEYINPPIPVCPPPRRKLK